MRARLTRIAIALSPFAPVVLRGVVLGAIVVLALDGVARLDGQAATLALFGAWTLVCVFAGAWLAHRREGGTASLPTFDPIKMFHWLRTGEAEPKAKDAEPPPIDDEPATRPMNWRL